MDHHVELDAFAGPERRASCGCVFVLARERAISQGGWASGNTIVQIPCVAGTAHRALAAPAVKVGSATLEEFVEEFEKLLKGGVET